MLSSSLYIYVIRCFQKIISKVLCTFIIIIIIIYLFSNVYSILYIIQTKKSVVKRIGNAFIYYKLTTLYIKTIKAILLIINLSKPLPKQKNRTIGRYNHKKIRSFLFDLQSITTSIIRNN